MTPALFNVFGLVANLFGVVLLFRYGMPYRVRTGGNKITLLSEVTDQSVVRLEKRFAVFGNIGLGLIIIGTLAQICAALLP